VVKASGLAAGKGVIICADRAAAEQALRAMLVEDRFGASGREVVIEEFLTGEEASLMVLIAGDQYVCLPPIQDHKRIGEGDSGPNTGGMGAYAPAPVLDADGLRRVEASIIRPTLAGLRAEGIDYRGTLFIGLMIEHGAAKVLEFNVRFGDPECQAVLPLCASDPVDLLHACATGSLQADTVRIHPDHTLIVVLAARGYPGDYPKGDCIGLPDTLPDNVSIIHAGTRRDADGTIRANGGRVLGVVGRGPTLAAAADAAYAVCAQIRWANAYYRRDIGWRALRKDRV
jgi:phosphoribosylamine--glycine ligase